ncbi:MAG: hypothetical protein HY619_03440 [Thaumarchaeota archaeon]|nr:hypothetical protein [Nitrososphaerota archaeon]
MNKEKVGRPFDYPNSYLRFLALVKTGFDVSYRVIEEIVKILSKYTGVVMGIHFTQIRRRMLPFIERESSLIDVRPVDPVQQPTVVFDSLGLRVTTKGVEIEENWRRDKKRYVKMNIMVKRRRKRIVDFKIIGRVGGALIPALQVERGLERDHLEAERDDAGLSVVEL